MDKLHLENKGFWIIISALILIWMSINIIKIFFTRIAMKKNQTPFLKGYPQSRPPGKKLHEIENSMYPRWFQRVRENLWNRGIRVIGGFFFLLMMVNYGIPKWDLNGIISLSQQAIGKQNPFLIFFMIVGISGLIVSAIDLTLSIFFVTVFAPKLLLKEIFFLIKVLRDQKSELDISKVQTAQASVTTIGKIVWICTKTGCKMVVTGVVGTSIPVAMDSYYESKNLVPPCKWFTDRVILNLHYSDQSPNCYPKSVINKPSYSKEVLPEGGWYNELVRKGQFKTLAHEQKFFDISQQNNKNK